MLKNDNQSDQPNLHEGTDHATDHFHAQELCQFPKAPDNYDPYKDVDGDRTTHQFINIIEKYGDQDNVDKVGNFKIDKIQKIQIGAVLVKL